MDIQLNELIEKIKKDGIESASEEAGRLKTQAEAEARRIIEAAKKEAAGIIARAGADADRSEKAGIAAVGQASRNLVLAFKGEIQKLLDAISARETTAAFDETTLKSLIPDLLGNWASGKGDDLAVLLPEAELGKVEGFLRDKLAKELKNGVELKA
ncbi:MAG: V-type ATP synthase subunit E, partial [Treponema sp.]|nr:V-type ATP synthase subunit E [Treponema sp.]